ncbi:MAG: hypothetical protein JNJ88_20595 [Planctomycetes bacterium]|nr:hypothetical protein [Planctomycetota bacterium]
MQQLTSTDLRIARAWLVFCAAIFLIFANWVPEEVDTEVGFQATRAIAERGELHLEPETPSAKRILEFASTPAAKGEAYNCRPGLNGLQYPYWGIAYSVIGVPAYFLGRTLDGLCSEIAASFASQSFTSQHLGGSDYFARAAVLALQPLFGAAALSLVFLACRRAGASPTSALLAAASLGFGTHFFPQARSGLSDMQAVFCVSLVLERALAFAAAPTAVRGLVVGAACGLGLLTKVHTVAAVPPLVLLCAARAAGVRSHLRALVLIAAGALPFALTFFVANALRWGSPWITGYEKSTAESWFYVPIHLGFTALLFAPSKGVAWFALPTFWIGLAGLGRLLLHKKWILVLPLALSALGAWTSVGRTIEWHGAWSFGPRYALLGYPAMAVAAALAIDMWSPRGRLFAGAVALAGCALVAPATFTSPFAAMAAAMEASAVREPKLGDQDRFQRLCLDAGPGGFLRAQHALGRAVLLRGGELPWRELDVDRDGAISVAALQQIPEYHSFGSIGWVGFGARFDRSALWAIPAILAVVAGLALLRVRQLARG